MKKTEAGEPTLTAAKPKTAEQLEAARSGLTTADVAQRHSAGQSNRVDSTTSRPVSAILRSNIFTLFNGILVVCAAAVLALGDWRDAVFSFVLILNMAIGILSELRSKHELDSLAVLQAPTSMVLRDGNWVDVANENLVVDDVLKVKLGDQIPADGQVLTQSGLEIDESALTGESHPVHKQNGDALMSGTAVVAGNGEMLVEIIGSDAWAQKITTEARKFSQVHSEIQDSINKILAWITLILPLMMILLVWSQLRSGDGDWRSAIIFSVAGIVGMIPQGLVLLTSMNFGIAAATLARRGVLVQELPAVEILARVDVLCLDKTGTLTTGEIRGRELITDPALTPLDFTTAVLAFMVEDDTNATADAVATLIPASNANAEEQYRQELKAAEVVPFNSARKWSALTFARSTSGAPKQMQTWVLGAPELLLSKDLPDDNWAVRAVGSAGDAGRRTVCLAYTNGPLQDETLPEALVPAAIAVLEEDIRPDAAQTLQYFRDQGVRAKIISGDSPRTVSAIAAEVGLEGVDGGTPKVLDARSLPPIGSEAFNQAALDTDVFGRVTPEQKRGLVHALQAGGHTVAMTGDGVNDALALKDADLGIAMGNAAPATKAVSRLVLVRGEFSVLPGVVGEGRRIIANMERVSSLFLSKTTYAFLFAILVATFGWVYPFLPRQFTYISMFTIGIPAFVLSLAPNPQKYIPGFLRRTLSIALPSGAILAATGTAAYLVAGQGTEAGRTAATITLIIGAMALLAMLARPWNWGRLALFVAMTGGAILGLAIPFTRVFFAMELPSSGQWVTIGGLGVVGAALIMLSFHFTSSFVEAYHEKRRHSSR